MCAERHVDSLHRVSGPRDLQRRQHDDAAAPALRDLSRSSERRIRRVHAREQSSGGAADDFAGDTAAAGVGRARDVSSGVHQPLRKYRSVLAEFLRFHVDDFVAAPTSGRDGRDGLRRAQGQAPNSHQLDPDDLLLAARGAPYPDCRAPGAQGCRDPVVRKRDPNEKQRKPEALGNVLGAFLKESKLEERVEAAQVVPEWESLVGKQIATVTKPISVTQDGTLFVSVKTNGWMTELSLMEPQLLRALNSKEGRTRIKKIRLQLMR